MLSAAGCRRVALAVALAAPGCGGGGAASAVGDLSIDACTIDAGASACQAGLSWSTVGASRPRLLVDGELVADAPSGRVEVLVDGSRARSVALNDGERQLEAGSARGTCASSSSWDGARCAVFAERVETRAPTPFVENGRAVSLEVVIFRPLSPGPHPAVVFHHGSTGDGSDPSSFRRTYVSESVARFFAERGFATIFPQRRGRGQSDGVYDEGFTADRSRYSCDRSLALAGFERALQDVDVAVQWVAARADVDAARLLSAGVSRGGALAVAHAGLRREAFRGVVNFVGGWLGEGCADAGIVNRTALLAGAGFPSPMLWLYGQADSFYSVTHTRAHFEAFLDAGGQGRYFAYQRAAGLDGHFVSNDPHLWQADLEAYLGALPR